MALTTEQATTGQQSVKSYRAAVVHDLGPPFTPGHEGVGTVTKTRVIREVRGLETVNESIADVEAGRVTARVVFEM